MLFEGLKRLILHQHPCQICQQITQDVLVVNGSEKSYYCRKHLLENFLKSSKQYGNRMIVFHPELDRRFCQTQYPYYPLNEFKKYFFSKEAHENISNLIKLIKGSCQVCNDIKATIGYFPKGALKWNSVGPLIEDDNLNPQSLCKTCCLKLITPDLENHNKSFNDNGLFCPYGGDGVYVSTFL